MNQNRLHHQPSHRLAYSTCCVRDWAEMGASVGLVAFGGVGDGGGEGGAGSGARVVVGRGRVVIGRGRCVGG